MTLLEYEKKNEKFPTTANQHEGRMTPIGIETLPISSPKDTNPNELSGTLPLVTQNNETDHIRKSYTIKSLGNNQMFEDPKNMTHQSFGTNTQVNADFNNDGDYPLMNI